MKMHRNEFNVANMCKAFNVSRSGFYLFCSRKPCERKQENIRIGALIKINFDRSRETYGYRRIYRDLKSQGESCSKYRVARIMKIQGIKPKTVRKFKVTTDSKHNKPIYDNTLNQNFFSTCPNQKWSSDITYIPTKEGWLYLAVVMDLFSRRIIGWSMSSRMKEDLVINALKMALFTRKINSSLLLHSDRGSQYASGNYQKILSLYSIKCSMSRVGNCYDNSVIETFFRTLKIESIYHNYFETREEAKKTIFEYIEVFYNQQRRHSYLDYLSPAEFESMAANR